YLLVRPDASTGRSAIALSKVSRLEEISIDLIEYSAGREVIQYRGGILPLIRLGDNSHPAAIEQDIIRIVVQPTEFGEVGLVVNDIIDIVSDDEAAMQQSAQTEGILGAAILQGHVTDFIDCEALFSRFNGKLRNEDSNGN
ncbi:chemotaxis protein CheW, partial [Alcanivorax jadensis]